MPEVMDPYEEVRDYNETIDPHLQYMLEDCDQGRRGRRGTFLIV